MALYSKNPGDWRTSANASLKCHRSTAAKIGNATGKPIDGVLDPATVQHGGNRRCKRVKRIAANRNETRTIHSSRRTGKNARKRASRSAFDRWQDYQAEVGSKEASGNGRGLASMYRKAAKLEAEYQETLA